jgi:hypothetical protein
MKFEKARNGPLWRLLD